MAPLRAGGARRWCRRRGPDAGERPRGTSGLHDRAGALREHVLRRRGTDRLDATSREPHRDADGGGRLRRPRHQPLRGERSGPLHARQPPRQPLHRGLPPPAARVSGRQADQSPGTRNRRSGLRHRPPGSAARLDVPAATHVQAARVPGQPRLRLARPRRTRRGDGRMDDRGSRHLRERVFAPGRPLATCDARDAPAAAAGLPRRRARVSSCSRSGSS